MNRFSDGWDMDNEGEGSKQMDQRLPTLIPGRKWFHFYKWENKKGEKVYMKGEFSFKYVDGLRCWWEVQAKISLEKWEMWD